MFAEQLRVGRPAPDYGRTTDRQVVAALPGGPANLSVTRWVLEQERQGDQPLTLPELQVLSELVRERRATTAELAQVLQRTEAETRNHLVRMVERGWVQARGEGKGRTWHLSAAVYRAVEASAGYVRVRGFEPLQQEQMVLAYVEAHRRITRAEAAELCAMLLKAIPDIRLLRSANPDIATQMTDLTAYRPVSAMPPIRRDISIAVDSDDLAEDLGDRIRDALGTDAACVESVEILHQTPYAALPAQILARLGAHWKQQNILVKIVLRHLDRTLSNHEANVMRDRVYTALHQGTVQQWATTCDST